jgi:hypothetical protein
MPELKGETLSGADTVLPDAARGRVALVVLGFTRASQHSVEPWVKRFRKEFGGDSRFTFYEAPMIGGMGRLAKPFIQGGMRRGTPKADYEHVITVFSGVDPFKKLVDYREPDTAYLLLLDPAGRIQWMGSGTLDEGRFAQLAAAARKAAP